MKKTIVFLTSLAALCSLISCEENKNDSKGNTDVIQSEEVTEAEIPFRDYKAEDFTDIKVNLNKQQTAPPVELNEYDLSWIEFEPKVSVCALPENRSIEKILPYYESDAKNFDMTPEEYAEEYMKLYEPLLDKPVYPSIECTATDGENIYYVAKYDKCCKYSIHDFEIYRCNPETKENECIFTYSNTDESFMVNDMAYYDGELWVIGNYSLLEGYVYESSNGIFRADTETNTLELSFEPHDDSWYIQGFYQTGDNRLITAYISYTEIGSELHFYEYNGGNWEEKEPPKYGSFIPYNGEFVTSYEKNKTLFTECSRFTLDTGLRSASLEAVSDKRATYMMQDSLSTILYTYDFEKMERYIIDLTSYGSNYACYAAGDNILIHQPTGKSGMYIIPELGAAFEIFRADFEPGMDYLSGEEYIFHSISKANGKIAILENCTVNDVYFFGGEISDNIPNETYYIGKDISRINKVYILGE